MSIKVLILGAGGHSKVILDALKLSNPGFEVSLSDENQALLGKNIAGYIVQAYTDLILASFDYAHVSIGNNLIREKMCKNILIRMELLSIMHPNAVIASSATVANGVFVGAQAILAPDSSVGTGSIINHAAVVDHDVKIGAYSHIAPNSTLGGNVKIGEGVFVGAGATVLPGITIGNRVTIGAGAVVVRDVADNLVVKGVPAG